MKIGFIGCGNMASAMIGGILRQGIFSKDEIIVSNLTDEGRARSEKTLGVVTTLDNNEIVRSAKTVVLAVKPQFYEKVLTEVHDSLTTEHTIIGIAPGKTLAWLEEKAGLPLKVVRFMPNTPAQVGAGMTAVCTNDRVSEDELAEILKITDSFGFIKKHNGSIHFNKTELLGILHFFRGTSKPVLISQDQLFHHCLHLRIQGMQVGTDLF
mgnify:FL=1